MKEIKDYLHLYLGCEINVAGQKEILDSVAQTGEIETLFRGHLRNYRHISDDTIKPILRPLSDMTEEERKELYSIPNGVEFIEGFIDLVITPERIKFLFSKHFDLFGLIEAGLAIDSTKITNK